MEIVADTNNFPAVALNEPEKDRIIQLTVDASVMASEILPFVVGNALSAMVKRRKLSKVEALEAEQVASRIPVRRVGVDIQDSLQLSVTHNMYA